MLGFKTVFATLTRGEGLLNRAFLKYDVHRGHLDGVRKGALVATEEGRATAFSIGGRLCGGCVAAVWRGVARCCRRGRGPRQAWQRNSRPAQPVPLLIAGL
jgi:hypothetical protein